MVLKTLFSDFRPSWLPNWLQHRYPKLVQNRPKTWKNRLQISTSLRDAPKMAPKLKNVPKNAKISQKSSYMTASWASHSNTIHAKSVSRDRFPGNSTIFKQVQQSTTTTPTWLHQTSAVGEGFSQPASKNTVHFFHFSTMACMHMVNQSWALEPLTMIAS